MRFNCNKNFFSTLKHIKKKYNGVTNIFNCTQNMCEMKYTINNEEFNQPIYYNKHNVHKPRIHNLISSNTEKMQQMSPIDVRTTKTIKTSADTLETQASEPTVQ